MIKLLPRFDNARAIHALQDSGITQILIAEYIGISQGRISQIANGIDADSLKYENRVKLFELCKKHGIKVLEIEVA